MGKPRVDRRAHARGCRSPGSGRRPRRRSSRTQQQAAGPTARPAPDEGEAAFDLKADAQRRSGGRDALRPGAGVRAGRPAPARHRRAARPVAGCPRGGDEPRRRAGSISTGSPERARAPVRSRASFPLAIALRDLLPAEAARARPLPSIRPTSAARPSAGCGCRSPAPRTSSRSRSCASACRAAAAASCRASSRACPRRRYSTAASSLRGTSLVRFLGWATANALTFDAKGDGTFGIRSQLIDRSRARRRARYHRRSVGNRDSPRTCNTAGRGGRRCRCASKARSSTRAPSCRPASSLADIFDVVLHGPLMSQRGGQSGGQGAARGLGAAKPGWRGAQTDASIRVNAGQLMTAARTYRDVAMEIELKGGRLRLPLLRDCRRRRLQPRAGRRCRRCRLAPEGQSARPWSAPRRRRRSLRWRSCSAFPKPFARTPGGRSAMVPLRLAGSMALGARTPTSADLVLDGEANGAGVKLNARFDGAPAGWRTGPADVTGLVEGNDAQVIAALLAPGGSSGRAGSPASGRVLVKASGVPSEGLASLASVEAGDLALRLPWAAGRAGERQLGRRRPRDQGSGRRAPRRARRTGAALAARRPAHRRLAQALGRQQHACARQAGAEDRRQRRQRAAFARQRPATGAGSRRASTSTSSPSPSCSALCWTSGWRWPRPPRRRSRAVRACGPTSRSTPRSSMASRATSGSTAKRLLLAEGMGLSRASLDIALQGGKVEVRQLEGACLGGRCSATLSIDKAPAGVEVSGSLSLAGGAIEASPAVAGKPRASGTISGEIKFSGKGTSPRSVLSVLQGSGTLEFGEAKLGTLWPGAIGMAASSRAQGGPRQAGRDPEADAGRGACRRRAAASGHGQRRDRRRAARRQAVRDRHRRGPRARRGEPRPQDAHVRRPSGGSSQKPRRRSGRQAGPAGRHGDLSRAGRRARRAWSRASIPTRSSASWPCAAWSATWRSWSGCASSTRRAAARRPSASAGSSSRRRCRRPCRSLPPPRPATPG